MEDISMEAHASDYYNSSSSITTDNIYPEQSGYEGDDWQQEHPNDDSIETIKAMVILWVLLLAFYCYDERRSRQLALEQTAMSEQRLQRTLQRLSEERRFDPERRKKEINEQIVTKEIQNSDDVRFLFDKNTNTDSLYLTSNSSYGSSNEKSEPGDSQDIEANYPITASIEDTECDNENVLPHSDGDDGSAVQPEEEKNDSKLVCSICLEGFEAGEKLSWARSQKCDHIFHNECLIPWLMNHDECPNCRTVVLENRDIIDKIAVENSHEDINHPTVDNI